MGPDLQLRRQAALAIVFSATCAPTAAIVVASRGHTAGRPAAARLCADDCTASNGVHDVLLLLLARADRRRDREVPGMKASPGQTHHCSLFLLLLVLLLLLLPAGRARRLHLNIDGIA
jgi:hypothetical protein